MLRILLLIILTIFFITYLSLCLIIPWVIFESWIGIIIMYFLHYTMFCFIMWISMGGEIPFLCVLAGPFIRIWDFLSNIIFKS